MSLKFLGWPLPRMLRLISGAVDGAARWLEVAAGTGLVTPALARAPHEVISTDYATAMPEVKQRVREAGLGNVQTTASKRLRPEAQLHGGVLQPCNREESTPPLRRR